MNEKYLFSIWMFLLITIVGYSQNSAPIIQSRSFEGLKRTKIQILERQLYHEVGMPFDSTILEKDLQALLRFEPIIAASYHLDTLKDGALHITYTLREGITRYPILFLGGLQNNLWWEVGYSDRNWGGNGAILNATLRQTDGRMGGSLFFQKPYLYQTRWGASLQLGRFASEEPLYFGSEQVDYFYLNHNVGVSLDYRFQPNEILTFGATLFREDYEKLNPEQIPGPQEAQELKQLVRLAYQLNKMKPDWIQPSGHHWQFSGELVFQEQQEHPFYLIRGAFRHFRPVAKKGVIAGRVSFGYSANDNTPFAPFVVDSRINIRGAGNRVDRGTASLVLNLEYRQQIVDHPWLLVQAVGFTDIGSWRSPGGTLEDLITLEEVKYFVGGGLRFIIPKAKQSVLRIDYGYGVQPLGTRGIVLGLGQYF